MIENRADSPPCNDPRPCFGKMEYRGQQRCRVLVETYKVGKKCPFCKSSIDYIPPEFRPEKKP